MSRNYEMDILITGLTDQAEIKKVANVVREHWVLDDYWPAGSENEQAGFSGKHQLAVGEGEDDFSYRIGQAIWKALDRYVEIEVRATYLEDLPYEVYYLEEQEYQEWREQQ